MNFLLKSSFETSKHLHLPVEGHLNPGLFNPKLQRKLFNPKVKNSWLKSLGLKSSWLKSLQLKGSGLKFGGDKSGLEMFFNLKCCLV